jgi:hypothetical protein
MINRSTTIAFALLVTMMLPAGNALAQGAARTTGVGNASGVTPGPAVPTGAPPEQSLPAAPSAVQGFAERGDPDASGPGLAETGPDGSTKIVPARPCSAAAHETDGTTTCIGIPGRR